MPRRSAKDSQQLTFGPYIVGGKSLDFQPDGAAVLPDIDFHLRSWLAEVMERCPKSRAEIAAGMTDAMFGEHGEAEVTRQQLDSWTRRTGGSWRFPASYLPAFERVTGDISILQRLAAPCGCVVLSGDQARLAQLGSLAALRRRIDSDEAAILKDLPQALIADIIKRAGGGS